MAGTGKTSTMIRCQGLMRINAKRTADTAPEAPRLLLVRAKTRRREDAEGSLPQRRTASVRAEVAGNGYEEQEAEQIGREARQGEPDRVCSGPAHAVRRSRPWRAGAARGDRSEMRKVAVRRSCR